MTAGSNDLWSVAQGLGTVAAVVVALGFGASAEWRLRNERRQHQAESAAHMTLAMRTQASRVSSWTEQALDGSWSAHIQNESEEPIWDVSVPKRSDHKFAGREDADNQAFEQARARVAVLPPHSIDALPIAIADDFDELRRHPWHVQFRDNDGKYWVRDVNAVLWRHTTWLSRVTLGITVFNIVDNVEYASANSPDARYRRGVQLGWKLYDDHGGVNDIRFEPRPDYAMDDLEREVGARAMDAMAQGRAEADRVMRPSGVRRIKEWWHRYMPRD